MVEADLFSAARAPVAPVITAPVIDAAGQIHAAQLRAAQDSLQDSLVYARYALLQIGNDLAAWMASPDGQELFALARRLGLLK